MPDRSIYAVKYAGPFNVYSGYNVWQWDMATEEFERENWYLWCVRGDGPTVVVDTGADPALTRSRKQADRYEDPTDVLARLDVDAATVEHVVLSHLHWDHAGGVHLFPSATFYVQAAEYRFWTEDPIAKRPPFANLTDPASIEYLTALDGTDRLVIVDGDREIIRGIECLHAPGHTPGQQAVAVDGTARARDPRVGLRAHVPQLPVRLAQRVQHGSRRVPAHLRQTPLSRVVDRPALPRARRRDARRLPVRRRGRHPTRLTASASVPCRRR